MKASGEKTELTGLECIFGPMEISIMASGVMTKCMVTDYTVTTMDPDLKGNSRTIKKTVMDFTNRRMGADLKGGGTKAKSMV